MLRVGWLSSAAVPSWLASILQFNTPDGEPLRLAALRDRVVLLELWTFACVNWKRTLPFLRRMHDQYQPDFTVVGRPQSRLRIRASVQNVERAVRKHGLDYPPRTGQRLRHLARTLCVSLAASDPAHRAVTTAGLPPQLTSEDPPMQSENTPPRLAVRTLGAALSTLLVASAAPYGYTLAVWSSGALLLRSHGVPNTGDVFIFVAGAIAGFNLLGLLVEEEIKKTMPIERRGDRLLAGVLDWVAVGAVVGAVSLLAEIHGWVPWLVAPFVATVLYLLLASLQLTALAIRHNRGRNGGQPIEEVIADAQRGDDRDQPRVDRA